MAEFLAMSHITKVYGNGILANYNVDLALDRGEIHALAGENGAGKSTLMKILYGIERADSGEIRLEGKRMEIRSPLDAVRLGIGMVHQHFMLVDALRVYENLFLGDPPLKGGFLGQRSMIEQTRALCRKFQMQLDPMAVCGSLPVGQAQKVEILKALNRSAKILILDEPTAVLTPQETGELFGQLRLLKAEGLTIVIITHKLQELMSLCDRVTVMKNGRTVGVYRIGEITAEELSYHMVGRDVRLDLEKTPPRRGDIVLAADHLTIAGKGEKPAVRDVTFRAYRGEILCLAGVEGNGQHEVVTAVTGLNRRWTGELRINGEDIHGKTIRGIRRMGLSHIAEDRLRHGADAAGSILDNMISLDYDRSLHPLGVMKLGKLQKRTRAWMQAYQVRAADPRQKLAMLSGGNMQKVLVAREIEQDPDILIADQPTRGVDVGAVELIHKRILELRDAGKAVLLVSSDMAEVFALADRILVFHEGEIMAEITDPALCTAEQLGRYMLGVDRMERKDFV